MPTSDWCIGIFEFVVSIMGIIKTMKILWWLQGPGSFSLGVSH